MSTSIPRALSQPPITSRLTRPEVENRMTSRSYISEIHLHFSYGRQGWCISCQIPSSHHHKPRVNEEQPIVLFRDLEAFAAAPHYACFCKFLLPSFCVPKESANNWVQIVLSSFSKNGIENKKSRCLNKRTGCRVALGQAPTALRLAQ